MALKNLKENVTREKELIKEIFTFYSQLSNLNMLYPSEKEDQRARERTVLTKTIVSSLNQLNLINNSLPQILDSITLVKKLEEKPVAPAAPAKSAPLKGVPLKGEKVKSLVKMKYEHKDGDGKKKEVNVTVSKEDKTDFLKELNISREAIRKLKKKSKKRIDKKTSDDSEGFKEASAFAKLANKYFLDTSYSLIKKGYFKKMEDDLRKANMPFLLTTYISIGLLSTLIALGSGILLTIAAFIIGGLMIGLQFSLSIIILPAAAFGLFYSYPYAERKGIEAKINREIPFVTIHMSAIAGSGIEPTKIFQIIAFGEEYPNTKKEIKKIINQVNIYGYDIVTALKNTASKTSSKKFAELLTGLASTISEGGGLSEFLDKRAETLLFEYKIEREKQTKVSETFMDVYISIMIMAPMMLMILMVIINMTGIDVGLSSTALTFIILLAIALVNIIAMVFLHLKQPSY